ncbi:MAG TPA: ribosome maturation factor RimP [Candidatus Stackebrandtia faecavium]|nr:ribosome maturation factor RimP [Candidatus Stackebrandtia faecavium]
MADLARERIQAVVEPVVTEQGYDLEELKVSQAGRRTLVRVMVDRDGGVDLDAIAAVSRTVSKALDSDEAESGPFSTSSYTLEVSSPGVDRPLTLPRHWRRNIGRKVKVDLGQGAVTGRVTAADENGVTLDLAEGHKSVAYRDLGSGRVQLEFSRSSGKNERQG